LIKNTLNVCKETFEAIKDMAEGVKNAVKEAFEEKAEECGQMTGERMKNMMEDYHAKMEHLIDVKLAELNHSFPPNQNDGASNENDDDDGHIFAEGEEEEIVTNNEAIRHRLYAYGGRFWHVPKDFAFPQGVRLDTGWRLWICGLPSNETVGTDGIRLQAPVRPFRILKPTMLPPDVRAKFQLHWKPIFSLMEGAPDLEILPGNSTESIALSFSVGKQHLKATVSYAFESERATPDQWEISTWSKKVARSSILKHGTVSDVANLPVATRHNQPRQLRQPRHRPLTDLRRTRRRNERAATEPQGGRGRARRTGGVAPPATNNGDAGGLPDVNLTATAMARGEAIEREVGEEMEEELREHRRLTNLGRPDGHGGEVFIGPRYATMFPH
jgi:hypothetical protein